MSQIRFVQTKRYLRIESIGRSSLLQRDVLNGLRSLLKTLSSRTSLLQRRVQTGRRSMESRSDRTRVMGQGHGIGRSSAMTKGSVGPAGYTVFCCRASRFSGADR
jgi:hypothetical protein